MIGGPEIALAASARDWPERLHRFLLDHGGGRVTARVMVPDQAVTDQYEVLFIDDVCSFLTPRLVRSLRDAGREIIGVYEPTDASDAKRRLLECGVTDVIESEASPEEFVDCAAATLLHRRTPEAAPRTRSTTFRLGVTGPLGGVGVTEVAIGVARGLASQRPTVLIDLDIPNPSVAHRLDLPLHPNLLTAVDVAHHGGSVTDTILEYEGLGIVGGLANPGGHWLTPFEVDGLLDEVGASGCEVIVADLGVVDRALLESVRFDALLVVGLGNPVGLSRLVRAIQSLPEDSLTDSTVAVVNRSGPGQRRAEIRGELSGLLSGVPVVLLPEDPRLERAAWDGSLPSRGRFSRSLADIASLIDGAAR